MLKVVLVSVEIVRLVFVQHIAQYASHPGGWILADCPDRWIQHGHGCVQTLRLVLFLIVF